MTDAADLPNGAGVVRKSSLGQAVQDLRLHSGLTQQELADLAGMSVAGLRDVEQGRVVRPRASTLRRLSTALNLSSADSGRLLRMCAGDAGDLSDGAWLGVLGAIQLTVKGAPVDPGSERQRMLLGILALQPNVLISKDALIEGVWGPCPPSGVDGLFQSRVSRLRKKLQPVPGGGGIGLSAERGGYVLIAKEDQHDLLKYRSLMAQARRRRDDGALAESRALFAQALDLWRGEPLSGLPVLQANPTVVCLVAEWQSAIAEYSEVAAELGSLGETLPLLRQAAARDPLHERIHARLMLSLAAAGEQAVALNVFDTLRKRLADELGADPGPELREAHQRVMRQQLPRPAAAPAVAYRQLPPDLADFCGRRRELSALQRRLPATERESRAVSIVCIEGMGGVGKTRLAVHAAYQLVAADRYAEQQLYADLHGHDTRPPASPFVVLGSFLRLLGVSASQIPADLDSRSALYRDRLHGKNALVLLDNAVDRDQVLPLVPAGPTNLVLITSRRSLALDGSSPIVLDVLTRHESRALLINHLGARRVKADPEATDVLVDLCGYLPAALTFVARQLQARPGWTIADLARHLKRADGGLSGLWAGGRTLSSIFDSSYEALEPHERRVFRLLGLHQALEFDAESVAALAGVTASEADSLLGRLVDEHLLGTATSGRYRLSTLLGEYAKARALHEESELIRRTAPDRLRTFHVVQRVAGLAG